MITNIMVGIVHLQNRLHKVLGIKNSIRIICVALMLFFCCGTGVFAAVTTSAGLSWDETPSIIDGGSTNSIQNRTAPVSSSLSPYGICFKVVQVAIPDSVSSGRNIRVDVQPVNVSNSFFGLTSVEDGTKSIPVRILVEYKIPGGWYRIIGDENQTSFDTPPQNGSYRGVWLILPTADEFPINNNPDLPDGAYYCTLLIRFSELLDDGSWHLLDEQMVQCFGGKNAGNMRNTPPVINVIPHLSSGFDMYDFIDRHTILDAGLVNVVSTLRTANDTPFVMNIYPEGHALNFCFEREGSVNSLAVPYEVSVDNKATWHDSEFSIDITGRNPLYTLGAAGTDAAYAPLDSRNTIYIRAANGANSSRLVGGRYSSTIVFEITTDH